MSSTSDIAKKAADDAIARMQVADNEALASSVAFTLGPDNFQQYYDKKAADATARLEKLYGELTGLRPKPIFDTSQPAKTSSRVDSSVGATTVRGG